MSPTTKQSPISIEMQPWNRKPAGVYGYRFSCRHQNLEIISKLVHPGSIFSESGPDHFEASAYCPDCGQSIYFPEKAGNNSESSSSLDTEISF